MSENQNRGVRDFSIYDAMDTEELKEILRLDCETDDGQESDTELLLYVMGVLAERKKNSKTPEITAQQAWESFQSNYLPANEEASIQVPKKSTKLSVAWLRRMVAAAAVIAILVCVPLAARAFDWKDIWNAVATWAKETFSFIDSNWSSDNEPNPESIQRYNSLQEVLVKTDQDADFVPTWIPDGYELKDIRIDELPERKTYVAFYKNKEKVLKICVQSYLHYAPQSTEINEGTPEIYEVSDVKYYIFSNNEQVRAVWIKNSYQCYISGNLTITEIKTMIDSIGKG